MGPEIPVLLDSGVRTGADVYLALALGASAVIIGRSAIYGLAAAGVTGVSRVLELLTDELRILMILSRRGGYRRHHRRAAAGGAPVTSDSAAERTPAPFPAAVRAGDLVYTSGLASIDPATMTPRAADFDGQCRDVLTQLEAALRDTGCAREHVVKLECFLADRKYYPAWNVAFVEFFGAHPPARTTTVTTLPAAGLLIEVQAVASPVKESCRCAPSACP